MTSNIEKVQEFIQEKEKDSIIGQIKELTGSDNSDNNSWDKDSDLMKYAELKLKDNLKIKETFELKLLELKLSIFKSSYFQEFQDFLEELKKGGGTTKSGQNSGDTSEGNRDFADVSPEISDGNVEQIAHIGSNWQSRSPGEKLEVSKEERKKFLFQNGEPPKSQSEMKSKYLTSITVPILDKNGNNSTIDLKVHKKLADNYTAVFKELKAEGIKIDSGHTGAYNWREKRGGNGMSEHSFGTAIDINWNVNGGVYGTTNKNSEFFNDQKTVEIFKKYGFAWGGDRSARSDDPMHFTYMGG